MAKNKKINYVYAVGRRKSASARVRLYKGKGESTVNGFPVKKYFGYAMDQAAWQNHLEFLTCRINIMLL